MNYLELHKRAVAIGMIPTEYTYIEEDACGDGFEETVWHFADRSGKNPKKPEWNYEFYSLNVLLKYYAKRINEKFEKAFPEQEGVKSCPRCETLNRKVDNTRYICVFCGMKYTENI